MRVSDFVSEINNVEDYPEFERLAHVIQLGLQEFIVNNIELRWVNGGRRTCCSYILWKWVRCANNFKCCQRFHQTHPSRGIWNTVHVNGELKIGLMNVDGALCKKINLLNRFFIRFSLTVENRYRQWSIKEKSGDHWTSKIVKYRQSYRPSAILLFILLLSARSPARHGVWNGVRSEDGQKQLPRTSSS